MNIRHLRHALATAAVIAALAATGCGSQNLNEDLGSDVDLLSSTDNAAPVMDDESNQGLKEIMEFEIDDDIALPIVELEEGYMTLAADSYWSKTNCDLTEIYTGMGYDGESFFQIMEPMLDFNIGEQDMAYAVWSFKGATEYEHITNIRIKGEGNFVIGGGYYIAFSNYDTGAYELRGPFYEMDQTIQVGEFSSYNKDGYGRFAIITYGADQLELLEIEIFVGDENAAQLA